MCNVEEFKMMEQQYKDEMLRLIKTSEVLNMDKVHSLTSVHGLIRFLDDGELTIMEMLARCNFAGFPISLAELNAILDYSLEAQMENM